MKIAILTFFKSGNFGGELQAYALQKKLRLMGYDVSVLHQLRPNNAEFVKSETFSPLIELQDKSSKKEKINRELNRIVTKVASIIYSKRYKLREKRFLDFENEHINLTEEIFYNFDQLYNAELNFDTYIVGSDQVWNYTYAFSIEPYFLTFVDEDKKKISYAASIGHSEIPDVLHAKYEKWFNNIDYISTREEQGEVLVKEISGKKAITVLDPTFLLTKKDWFDNLPIKNDNKEPYLLIYNLVESPYIFELARHIAKEKNIRKIKRVISKCWTREHYKGVENIYDAGPVEFLNLFAGASFVLTNSFHGTAFSINFNIPFYSIPRKNKKNNSRFINILKKTGISDRLVYDGDPFPKKENFEMDFVHVNELLNSERKESLDFLINSIEK